MGASRDAPADEIDALITVALVESGLAAESVRALATVDVKTGEPGIVTVAERRGWPVVAYPAAELAGVGDSVRGLV